MTGKVRKLQEDLFDIISPRHGAFNNVMPLF